MRRRSAFALLAVLLTAAMGMSAGCAQAQNEQRSSKTSQNVKVRVDTIPESQRDNPDRYEHLTESDFRKVAEELNVETAAIKAVVSIEAGAAMKGFWAPGIPVINFDRTMYNKYASKATSRAGAKGETVPKGLTGQALREWTQLINARKINAQGANMGTFWGMFQIGGFNYKLCGCQSVDEFVRLMSYSELEQLELFAAFIRNTGFVNDLRALNWAGFARKYNGPSYAKRGYHTKMANAYAKFKAEEKKKVPTGPLEYVAGKSLKAAPAPSQEK
ncbi:MAG: N-acetylmuramidase family protein [Muribaculaceae bacterium]|nr:N-acetylmuramidase family protein [Muribaculaceae bacterium]